MMVQRYDSYHDSGVPECPEWYVPLCVFYLTTPSVANIVYFGGKLMKLEYRVSVKSYVYLV